MADITLYTNPMSRGRIARWALEETGAAYDTVYINYGPEMKSPDYLSINPMGKVPALKHGNIVISEVAAICAHLGDQFPNAELAPGIGSLERGTYFRWLFFGPGVVEPAVMTKNLGFEVPQEKIGTVGHGSFELVMDTLEDALRGRDYLVGDRFTMADLYIGAQITWGLQFGTMEERPGFRAYVERVTARPAYQAATAIDDAALAERS